MKSLLLLLAAVWLAPPALAQGELFLVVTDGKGNRESYVPVRLQQGRVVVDDADGDEGNLVLTAIAGFAADPGTFAGPVEGAPYEALCGGSGACGDLRWSCDAAEGCACSIVVTDGRACSLPILPAAALGEAGGANGPLERPSRLTVYGWDPASRRTAAAGDADAARFGQYILYADEGVSHGERASSRVEWVIEPGEDGSDFACLASRDGQRCGVGGILVVRD